MNAGSSLPADQQTTSIPELEKKTRDELVALGIQLGLQNVDYLRTDDLVHRIVQAHGERRGVVMASGILEIINDGYGFLRHGNLHHSINDVYVSQSQTRRFGLRTGDFVSGQIRSPKSGEKFYGLLRVDSVNDEQPERARVRLPFDQLTALFPDKMFDLETNQGNLATRLLNLVAPMGKGQRGLIVSPPKAGKTILLHQIAAALTLKYPDTHVIAALIGERPEEVTDWERTVHGAEIVASTFDEPVEEHTRVAEIALERAKRLVEAGRDVVILLDSITRLTRAYNLASPSSGRTLSGGIDPVALYPPKRFFGAARNTEEGGTLTIIATCLVDTGSRMDEVIYEEFKGTGNMEVHLDRKLAERRTYPAIEILRSGTRRDERLYDETTYKGIVTLRRMLAMLSSSSMDSAEATERILDRLSKTRTNADFLLTLSKEM
ncbi:MAG: transcription termination factor Rho [Chloroflexi bacterium]|nr:transcription termination factor Rho [Chloroflexota bacterium]